MLSFLPKVLIESTPVQHTFPVGAVWVDRSEVELANPIANKPTGTIR